MIRERAGLPLATVALGSNVGARREHLERAVREMRRHPALRVVAVSPWIETEPVGGPLGQPRFLNGVLQLESGLGPLALLRFLRKLELEAGRPATGRLRDGPRTLDLDLLLFESLRIHSRDLVLPHPRMEERLFVLEPLLAIAPDLVLPTCNKTVAARVRELRAPAASHLGLL